MVAKAELEVVVKGRNELGPDLAKMESQVIRTVGAISAALAGIRLASMPIVSAREFERELANVTKTTNFTTVQVQRLGVELLKMSGRLDVAATDLAKIAAAAGQQGLGREGVEGVTAFTESVSRMASVLDLTAEEAADNIGKILNIFKTPIRDIERVVSTFNEVANNSTANGEQLLDVVRRIGDAAGSINLQQAVGLAATGLDFGQSPEVVGTAYAKIFSSLFEKADKFGQLMGMSADNWIKTMQTDGIDAFKQVLGQLRTLTPQDQMKNIVKLFGGGRIGVLVQKLVRDINNEVLDRNIQNAMEGSQGISAIKEQQTVLRTFDAQVKIMANVIKSLGIRALWQDIGEGATAMQRLTAYTSEFSESLKDPGVQSFINALIGGVTDLVQGFMAVGNVIAGLNVNWENFIRLGTAFVGLKLAQGAAGMVARYAGLNTVLQSTSKELATVEKAQQGAASSARAAGAADAAANAQAKSSLAARILGVQELEQRYRAFYARRQADAVATAKIEQAQQQAALARAEQNMRQQAVNKGRSALGGRAADVASATADLRIIEDARTAYILDAENRRAASIAQRESTRQAQTLQAEQAYQARLNAIKASGSRAGMAELNREMARQQGLIEAQYTRSINSVNAYWDRRIRIETERADQASRIPREALAKANQAFDTAFQAQQGREGMLTSATAGTTKAANDLKMAQGALATTTVQLSLFSRASAAAGLAFRSFVGIVASGARILLAAFGWVTLLYSIADALGLVDKLGASFRKLTDAIGLTSKAQRDKAVSDEQERIRIVERRKALQELVAEYERLQNVEGRLSPVTIQNLVIDASQSNDLAERIKSLDQLTAAAEGATLKVGEFTGLAVAAQAENLKRAEREISTVQGLIAVQEKRLASISSAPGAGVALTNKLESDLSALQVRLRNAEKAAAMFRDALEGSSVAGKKAAEDMDVLAKALGGMHTKESIQAFKDFVVPIAETREEIKKATAEVDKYGVAMTQAAGQSEEAQLKAEVQYNEALEKLQALNAQEAKRKQALIDYQSQLRNDPGVPENVLKSVQDLSQYVNYAYERVQALLQVFGRMSALNVPLTGEFAGVVRPGTSTGTNTNNPGGSDGAARREARARLKFERETIQQENAMKEEQSKQELARQERLYSRGLMAIEDYYTQRERVQLEANQFDIDSKRRELEEVNQEIAAAADNGERFRYMADRARLEGEINILQEQRKGIADANTEEMRRAFEQFHDMAMSETAKLYDSFTIDADMQQRFDTSLAVLEGQYRETINRLVSQGRKDLADNLQKMIKFEALDSSMNQANAAISLVEGNLTRMQQSLQLIAQAGDATGQAIEASFNDALRKSIPVLREQVNLMTEQIRLFGIENGTSSIAYQQRVAQLEDTKLRLAQMLSQVDATARGINQSVTDSVANAFSAVNANLNNLGEVAQQLITNIVTSIRDVLAQNLAERLMGMLGSSGGGGIGGFFQNLMQTGDVFNNPAGTKRGESMASPLYVLDVAGGGAAGQMGNIARTVADGFASSSAMGGADGLGGTLEAFMQNGVKIDGEASEGFLSSMMDGLTGIFGSLSDTLGGLFSGLMDGLGGLFSGLFSGGGGGGFFASIFGAVAHSGGTVGEAGLTSRTVSPLAFAGAARSAELPGIRSDEVPMILQKGETVRTEGQEAALQRALEGADSQTAAGVTNIWVVTPDQQPGASENDIIVTVADNIERGGRIKQLIRSIPNR